MPKYLCKTTMYNSGGVAICEYGLIYPGDKLLRNGRSIEDTVSSGNSADGSHNAFELVKVEWPEAMPLSPADSRMSIRHHASGNRARINFCGYIIEKGGVKDIHEFTGKWLEAAESEAGE